METIILSGNVAVPLKYKLNSSLEIGVWAIRIEQIVITKQKGSPSEVICDLRVNLLQGYLDKKCRFSYGQIALFPLPISSQSSAVVPLSNCGWHPISKNEPNLIVTAFDSKSNEPVATTDYDICIHLSLQRQQ